MSKTRYNFITLHVVTSSFNVSCIIGYQYVQKDNAK